MAASGILPSAHVIWVLYPFHVCLLPCEFVLVPQLHTFGNSATACFTLCFNCRSMRVGSGWSRPSPFLGRPRLDGFLISGLFCFSDTTPFSLASTSVAS